MIKARLKMMFDGWLQGDIHAGYVSRIINTWDRHRGCHTERLTTVGRVLPVERMGAPMDDLCVPVLPVPHGVSYCVPLVPHGISFCALLVSHIILLARFPTMLLLISAVRGWHLSPARRVTHLSPAGSHICHLQGRAEGGEV